MATTARPLFVCLSLCLCCASSCLCANEEDQLGAGGYRVRAVAVDKGGTLLRAELAAVAAGGDVSAAYGEDVQNLDVYARCHS